MAGGADYVFLITIADEGVVQLESCLGFLRAAYPEAPVTVISDGVDNKDYAPTCARHGVTYVKGAYLKRAECGGAWWHRLLTYGAQTKPKWIVKLDPTAKVWRRFNGTPPHAICGMLEASGTEHENIQDGCQIISMEMAQRILDSKRLDDPILKEHVPFVPNGQLLSQHMALAALATDRTLMWLIRNLGIDHGNWPEVGVVNLPVMGNNTTQYAVTYPHKLAVAPKFRDAPLYVITTCKGRLEHLKQTLPQWVSEPNVHVTVVDYDCPDGTTAWVLANYPQVTVVHVKGVDNFNLAKARNIGAAHTEKGWWCFFDADCLCKPGWANAVRESLQHRRYLLASSPNWNQFGSAVVHSCDYTAIGGYDELFRAWGAEDSDMYGRLRHIGIRPGSYPSEFFASIKHNEEDRTRFYDIKKILASRDFYDHYVKKKVAYMASTGQIPDEAKRLQFLAETSRERGNADTEALFPIPVESAPSLSIYTPEAVEEIIKEGIELAKAVEKVAEQVSKELGSEVEGHAIVWGGLLLTVVVFALWAYMVG